MRSPLDMLFTVTQMADIYNQKPSGINRAQLAMALANLEHIPGHGSGPQRAQDAMQHLATQLNRVAAAICFPGPSWDPTLFPDLASALIGYAARVQQQYNAGIWRVAEFWSSSNPKNKVLMLAVGKDEIDEWEQRGDFIRWISPDPRDAV